jgi:hypothetical protein
MMGKEAWVAGADRGGAPGPKPGHLGRRLRLRHQPPGSWQFLNGGVQREVSNIPHHCFSAAGRKAPFFVARCARRTNRRSPHQYTTPTHAILPGKVFVCPHCLRKTHFRVTTRFLCLTRQRVSLLPSHRYDPNRHPAPLTACCLASLRRTGEQKRARS